MSDLPTWLTEHAGRLDASIAADRLPHALLIHGPDGSGRRLLALWLAGRLLDRVGADISQAVFSSAGFDTDALAAHPDLSIIQPEPDKRSISIDQVRVLIASLQLTSHQSGWKVGLICPARALTKAAANSLLKTLEEPPAGSLLLLVSDSVSVLPATIVSRCQRLRIARPLRDQALAWLDREVPGVAWPASLELASGAPFRALREQAAGLPEQAEAMERDIARLIGRDTGPKRVAERWARRDPATCLNWLYMRASREIRGQLAGPGPESTADAPAMHLQNQDKPLNIDARFTYLREIADLRRLEGSGVNFELNLMYLLSRWYGGFQVE